MHRPLSLFVGLVALSSGCHSSSDVSPDDEQKAVEVVTAALDAWQQDKLPGPASRTPPIRFSDDDLVAGCRIVDFELPEDALQRHGGILHIMFELTLDNRSGGTVRCRAEYQVTLSPPFAVLRSDC